MVLCVSLLAAHATPGHVQLSLRCTDSSSGQRTTLHTAQFTYTLHDHRSLAERLLRLQQQQNTNEGLPLQLDLIPLSESPTELAELDRSLTAAVAEWELPLHWSLVQDSSGSGEDRGGGLVECAVKWTLCSKLCIGLQ